METKLPEKSGGELEIHLDIKIPKPDAPKVVVAQKNKIIGDTTAAKVKKFGSFLEKDAVHGANTFKRRGISVKDSRAS